MSTQGSLLRQRRFLPFFITQFLGAFNDNFYKNALVVLLTFQSARITDIEPGILVNLSAGLFILPYFLFSALAGQLADKYEKSRLIRYTKLLEIAIALIGAVALICNSLWLIMTTLFLMGLQSTLFGPVKYAWLPQQLREEKELISGNALVESGTFLAILLGTIAGGQIVALENGTVLVALGMVLLAVGGYLSSRWVLPSPAADSGLQIRWNLLAETWKIISMTRANRTVFLSILGISWFWFYGALFLSQFPGYAQQVLGGNENAVTLMLATFSVGIGVGSTLCEKFSLGKVEIGLVPFGSIGLTLFALDLWWASPAAGSMGSGLALGALLGQPVVWRIIVDLLMIGIFGGFFIVPLYSVVQLRSDPERRSRVIACNNIINALFMVVAALMGAVLLAAGVSIAGLILITAIFNALIAIYIYTLVPEFLWRFIVWLLVHTVCRFRQKGAQHIPDTGPALLVANHPSLVDVPVIMAAIRRPVRFVVDARYLRWPVIGFVLRSSGAIAAPGLYDGGEWQASTLQAMAGALQKGELVCCFPEGDIEPDGQLLPVRLDLKPVLDQAQIQVPVFAVALGGAGGRTLSGALRGALFRRIKVTVSGALQSHDLMAQGLQDRMRALLPVGKKRG